MMCYIIDYKINKLIKKNNKLIEKMKVYLKFIQN